MNKNFIIRPLQRDDWQSYRDIRLAALKSFEKNYGSRYVDEAAYPDQEWIQRVIDPKGKIFGLFDGDNLIGTSVIYTYRDDPSGKTALMAGWYMHDAYRGKGFFSQLVQASLAWAKNQQRFEKIRVHHRGDNHASRANIVKAGFTHTGTEDWTWPDGVTTDFCMYEKVFER